MGEIQSTQERLYITFRSEEDIIQFVDVCCNYDDAIDIRVDRKSTDAKSVLGMLLLKTGQPMEIEYGCFDDENNYAEFREEILQKFDIRVVAVAQKKEESAE